VVTAGADMYLLQELAALIAEDALHEYAGSPALVEFVVDEDKCFCWVGDDVGVLDRQPTKGSTRGR
jgi:hypothetical protein